MVQTWKSYDVRPYNAHYSGSYSDEGMKWKLVTAFGKAEHIKRVLGTRAAEIESVLDVGCGTGSVMWALAKLGIGKRYRGVDLADPVAHAASQLDELDTVEIERYDGLTLPFGDNTFDLVFASHVLEHVPNERAFLAELRRVARKYVCIEVPCELNLLTSRARLQWTLTDAGHLNPYLPESFLLRLETSDLRVLCWGLFDLSFEARRLLSGALRAGIVRFIKGIPLLLGPIFASRIFTYHCCALCVASGTGAGVASENQDSVGFAPD